jgi:uncharacterized protein YqeY
MNLEKQISQGIMEAMKARQTVRLTTLRNVKKYILEAKTAGANIDELPDADTLKIIQKLAKQGTESAGIYRTQGRADLADEEMAQVEVLREFLPRALSDDELAAAVRAVIVEVGASGMQDMGRVMGVVSKRLAGQAEGGRISGKVRELLA